MKNVIIFLALTSIYSSNLWADGIYNDLVHTYKKADFNMQKINNNRNERILKALIRHSSTSDLDGLLRDIMIERGISNIPLDQNVSDNLKSYVENKIPSDWNQIEVSVESMSHNESDSKITVNLVFYFVYVPGNTNYLFFELEVLPNGNYSLIKESSFVGRSFNS